MDNIKQENNVGKWNDWYKDLNSEPGSFRYGETGTYQLSADFLNDCKDVEDWGCGAGGFLRFMPNAIGVDGSDTPFAKKKFINLREYVNKVEGIHIRHVFEHNYNWKDILENALKSATKKLAITMFIPLSNETIELSHNLPHGVDVPDLSISEKEFMSIVEKYNPLKITRKLYDTPTGYGKEETIFIELRMKINLISASFGNLRPLVINNHEELERFNVKLSIYNNSNYQDRHLSMSDRMKGKIPKMLEWENTLVDEYDYYIWIDSKFTIENGFITKLINDLGDSDMGLFRHPYRSSINEEINYMLSLMNKGNDYLLSRYQGEDFLNQKNRYYSDEHFIDDKLFACGCFIYKKSIIENRDYNLLKDWFYHNTLYTLQDQLSLPYLLMKHNTRYHIFDINLLGNSDQLGDTCCILYTPDNQGKVIHHKRKTIIASRSVNRNNPLKQNKQNSYYGFARPEVIEAIIKNNLPTGKVLEIGCAGGATGKNLKERLPVQSYVGIELSQEAADIAKGYLDRVIVADIEKTDLAHEHGLQPGEFDLLLALDVLEHLYNPWDILAEMTQYVKLGGYVVASIPNIQNIAVLQDLVQGNWRYQDAGILDATHLRFFTLEETKKMFNGAGLTIKSVEYVINPPLDMEKVEESGNNYRVGNLAITNLTKDEVLRLFTYQYILIAQKVSSDVEDATAKLQRNSDNATPNEDLLLPHIKNNQFVQALTSIIILTHNQLEHTKLCLQSIKKYTPQPYELILVDNGSTDGTLDYLRKYANDHSNVRVIANKENLGFAAGNNQGLALAGGDYLLLLNNDTVVTEGWLAHMLSVFERYSEVGIVGPVSNYVSGPQQVKEASYQSLKKMPHFAKQWSAAHMGQTVEFYRVVGFCLLAKREVIDRIGGLDEQFGSGNFEDDDFCLRAAVAGYKARIAQDAFIHHTGSQTFKGAGINYQQSLLRNWEIFKTKWKLPQDLPYGAKYTLNIDTSDLSQYYIPLPPRAGISPLIINTTPNEKAEDTAAPIVMFEKMVQTAQTAGNWEQAIQLLTEALNLNQTNNDAVSLWNDLGYSYFMADLPQQAEIAFNSGLEINPQNLDLLNNLASLYLHVADYDKATDFVNRALRLNPHDVGALRTLGDCAIKLAKFDVALRAYEHVKKLSPATDGIDQVIADLVRLAGATATEQDKTAPNPTTA